MSSYLDRGDKQKRKQNKTGLKITFSLVGFGLVNFNGLVLGRRMVWSSLLCLNLAWSRRMGQTETSTGPYRSCAVLLAIPNPLVVILVFGKAGGLVRFSLFDFSLV